jgi:hypothetical protein
MEPRFRELGDELAARVRSNGIEGQGYGAKALAAALLYVDARAGMPAKEAVARARAVLEGDVLLVMENGRAAFLAAVIVLSAADSELARPALERGLEKARQRGGRPGDSRGPAVELPGASRAGRADGRDRRRRDRAGDERRVRGRRRSLGGGLEDALECGRRFEAVGGRNPAFLAWRSRAALCLTQLGSDPD